MVHLRERTACFPRGDVDASQFSRTISHVRNSPHFMKAKDHGPQIKDDKKYEDLRDKGMSKSKAARIANTPDASHKGGKAKKYEDRTKEDLLKQARKIGIEGRSKMNKDELIHALRHH